MFLYLDLDPGLVGLSLVYVITLADMFQYCVRTSAEVENLVKKHDIGCYSSCFCFLSWYQWRELWLMVN